jgi:hypothetical protein
LIGYISDFKIYTTACTIDDVKYNYRLRKSIDNLGNSLVKEINIKDNVSAISITGIQYASTIQESTADNC